MTAAQIAMQVDQAYFRDHPATVVLHRPIIFGEDGFIGDGTINALRQFAQYTVIAIKLPSGEVFSRAVRPAPQDLDDIASALLLAASS